MSEQPGIGASTPMPVMALLGAPFAAVIDHWESRHPEAEPDPGVVDRAPAVLDAVKALTGHPGVDGLRAGVARRDDRALGALVQLSSFLGMACDAIVERCKRWRRDENWPALREESALAARLTAAAGREAQQALALFLLANALRALDDPAGTIAVYEETIRAASRARDEHLLAAAHDNVGNALADVGRLDDALDHYREAILHETDPRGRRAILVNSASLLRRLGELRSAAELHRKAVAELEQAEIGGRELAIALDDAASALVGLGELAEALVMLERARGQLAPNEEKDRCVNALLRSEVSHGLGRMSDAAGAFAEAHDLAFDVARRSIAPEHYRRGFLAARASRLPPTDEAHRLFALGIESKDGDDWGRSRELLRRAAHLARDAGDHALALRIAANEAALLTDFGQVTEAFPLAASVRLEAAERGLARPELMAIGTLGSLRALGAEVHQALGPLGDFATSATLLDVHATIVAAAGLPPEEAAFETFDPSAVANELALLASAHDALDLAEKYFREAVQKARTSQGWFQLANRLAGLRRVLEAQGKSEDADAVADELAKLLGAGVLRARGQLVAHRALSAHLRGRDRTAAIDHQRRACTILEDLRRQLEPGPKRAEVARQNQELYRTLAQLLREEGRTAESFEALQGAKGRRLIDSLASLPEWRAAASDAPPTASEVMALIAKLGGEEPTVLVDLVVCPDGLAAYLVDASSVRVLHVPGDPANLAAAEHGDVFEREARLVTLCLREPLLASLAEAVSAAVPEARRLLLVADTILHNLPLHAVPVKGRPWCDQAPIGYLPAAGALRFAPRRRQPVGRSLIVGDSREDLLNAARECEEVGKALMSRPLIGRQCTRVAIEAALTSGELDVVHFALHGRGDALRGGRSSLLLSDGRGGTEWVAFEELASLPWRSELVVFSGCSTAVAGPRQGHELIGVARAAAERGAGAVIACLWPVRDGVARRFMTAFYGELVSRREVGPVDLRVTLDVARKTLRRRKGAPVPPGERRRDGRDPSRSEPVGARGAPDPAVADALAWAPFVLLGDPILGD
jgi:CHAT domain-containing protein/tetratricopeptide (TPR) repeat protein